jgi:hypothetical protein
MKLAYATWNTLAGGIDAGDDARFRRQMAVIAGLDLSAIAFQFSDRSLLDRAFELRIHVTDMSMTLADSFCDRRGSLLVAHPSGSLSGRRGRRIDRQPKTTVLVPEHQAPLRIFQGKDMTTIDSADSPGVSAAASAIRATGSAPRQARGGPVIKISMARAGVLAALAGQPGGMTVRELQAELPDDLQRSVPDATRRELRAGHAKYAPARDGRRGARALQLTRAGRRAAGLPAQPAPAPGRLTLAEGSRGRDILALLSGEGGDGMTCAEIITAHGGTPDAATQRHYNVTLDRALRLEYVTRRKETRADRLGRRNAVWAWQATQAGRDALAAAQAPPQEGPARSSATQQPCQ